MSDPYVLFRIDGDDERRDIYFALNANLAATMRDLSLNGGDFSYMVSDWPGVWVATGQMAPDNFDWVSGKGFSMAMSTLGELDDLDIDPPSGPCPETRVSLNPGKSLRVWCQGIYGSATADLNALDVAASALIAINVADPSIKPESLWKKGKHAKIPEESLDVIIIENKDDVSLLVAFPEGFLRKTESIRFGESGALLGQYVSLRGQAAAVDCFIGEKDGVGFLSMTKKEVGDFLERHETDAGAEGVSVDLDASGRLTIWAWDTDINGNPGSDAEFSMPVGDVTAKFGKRVKQAPKPVR